MIITVDCGIRGNEPIRLARSLGIDVVVTDHHELGADLPDAVAIVNPKDYKGTYPFEGIAGVGVAFKLAWALCTSFSPGMNGKVKPLLRNFLMDALGLVALGTVADVAPIRGENRILVRHGLPHLEKTANVGIRALKEITNLNNVSPLTPQHVGFRLGPRINAMGRMEHAAHCVELLTTEDYARALSLARQMDQENRKRKNCQENILQQARHQIESQGFSRDKVLVLAKENWHPGVIGIVASNLQSEYYRPVCIISLNNGMGKGSARSIPGFHLCKALQHCEEYLNDYGGHERAAGFQIEKEKIPHFRAAINRHAESLLNEEDLQPTVEIEVAMELDEITWDLFYQIEKMAPFGEGNPYPIMAVYDVEISKNPMPQRCGSRGEHLTLWVKKGKSLFRAIAFSQGALWPRIQQSKSCDLAFALNKNVWGGMESLELELKDIHFPQ